MIIELLLAVTLSDGLAAVNAGDYEKAQKNFAQFVNEHPNDAGLAQATLWLARLEQNPETSRKIYLQVVDNYRQSPYADSAFLEASSIDYAFGLYQQAATKLKQLLALYPGSPLVPESNYWLGVCYIILGDKTSAEASFKRAKDAGAGSLWGTLAQKELDGLNNSSTSPPQNEGGFSVQVGSFSDRSRAEKLLSDYKTKGRAGEIKEVGVSGSTYYRVWLGPFNTEADARNYAETLKAQGTAAMVVKR